MREVCKMIFVQSHFKTTQKRVPAESRFNPNGILHFHAVEISRITMTQWGSHEILMTKHNFSFFHGFLEEMKQAAHLPRVIHGLKNARDDFLFFSR